MKLYGCYDPKLDGQDVKYLGPATEKETQQHGIINGQRDLRQDLIAVETRYSKRAIVSIHRVEEWGLLEERR